MATSSDGSYVPFDFLSHPTMAIPGTGYTPNYEQLALNEPGYKQWLSNANRQIGQAGDTRRAAARFAAIGYGGLPPGFSDPYGDLDPATMAQAQANPNSTQARLLAGYNAAGQQLQTSLAARGALHSGDLVQGQQQLDQGYSGNTSDAVNAFIQSMTGPGGAYGTYEDAATQAMSGQGVALTGAVTALENNPAYKPVDPTVATLDPNWISNYGFPTYVGPDGTTYVADPQTGVLTPWTPGTSIPGVGDPATGPGPAPYVPPGGPAVPF